MATITPTQTLRGHPSHDSAHDPRGVWEFAVPLNPDEVSFISDIRWLHCTIAVFNLPSTDLTIRVYVYRVT